jgi:hypothetical protein
MRQLSAWTRMVLLLVGVGLIGGLGLAWLRLMISGPRESAFLRRLGLAGPTPTVPAGRAQLEPEKGIYFGVNLDWATDSPAAFKTRLGHRAIVFVRFFQFPFADADREGFAELVNAAAGQNGMVMITLEPVGGLDRVTPEAAEDLAGMLAGANADGVPAFVRFAHEMNGSWYAWSQQPSAYVKAFRLVADAVHRQAPASAMMWAPNYGGDYPFSGGRFEAKPTDPDFALLDTDGDGRLSMADDMYGPYYPGDDAVDWVGMSLYHWGNANPWGENELPEPDKLASQLGGTYNGLNGDNSAVPDFYDVYYNQHHKPVAIAETAALYNPGQPGPDELAIKQSWWRQVFDREMLAAHPGLKMINWFEHAKPEAEIGGATIDWRATGSPEIAAAFQADLPVDLLIFAGQ